jgi:hypothetical protein
MTKRVLVDAWECWDGSEGSHSYEEMDIESYAEAEAKGLELAFALLDPYRNDIKHYAEYRAEHFGDDPKDVIHETMLECARFEIWEKA